MIRRLHERRGLALGLMCVAVVLPFLSICCLCPGVKAQDPFPQPVLKSPESTTQQSGSPMVVIIAPVPSSPASGTVPTPAGSSSSALPTALGQRDGTGSPSAILPKPGQGTDKVNDALKNLDALLVQLKESAKGLDSGKPLVSISPTLPPEISQSLSQTCSLVWWLVLAVLILLMSFATAKAYQLAARGVVGLQKWSAAGSAALSRLKELEANLLQRTVLPGDTPGAASMTPPPAS